MVCRPHLYVRAQDLRVALRTSPAEALGILQSLKHAVREARSRNPSPKTAEAMARALGPDAHPTTHTLLNQQLVCFDFGPSRSPRLRAVCWISPKDDKVYCLHIVSAARWSKPSLRDAGLAEARARLNEILLHYR